MESDGGLYLIQTLDKVEADRKEFDTQRDAQSARIAQAISEQRWNQYLAALKENAKIIDNRETLFARPDTAVAR